MVSSVLQAMKKYGFDEGIFKKEFGLERDNWIIRGESFLSENPKEWEKLVHRFEDKLNRLGEKLKGHKIIISFRVRLFWLLAWEQLWAQNMKLFYISIVLE